MKKKLNEIFDEMSPSELEAFGDALSAPDLEEKELAAIKERVHATLKIKKKGSLARVWFRVGIIAACLAVIIPVAVLSTLLFRKEDVDIEEPTDMEPTEAKPDIIIDNSNSYVEYMSFEGCIKASTDIFKGRCIGIIEHTEVIEYEFSVTERFLGEDTNSSVFVYARRRSYTYTNPEGEVVTVINGLEETPNYEIGSEYYMMLSRNISVYYEHDRYYPTSAGLYIPADDISNSTMHGGESLLAHSELEKLDTEQELRDYILKIISDFELDSKPLYTGDPYILATDMKSIIEGSEYVVKIKIQSQKYADSKHGNKDIYLCIVTDSLSGGLERDEIIGVTFFPDTVSVGEEYILAVNLVLDTATPKLYHFSSKNSLFSLSQYDEIKEFINKGQ